MNHIEILRDMGTEHDAISCSIVNAFNVINSNRECPNDIKLKLTRNYIDMQSFRGFVYPS